MTEPRDLAAEYADLDYPDRDPYPRRWIPSWLIWLTTAVLLANIFTGWWWPILPGTGIMLAAFVQQVRIQRWWKRNPS